MVNLAAVIKKPAETEEMDLIDQAVRFINERVAETYIRTSIEIGEYILTYFFNDDIELASSKNPRKSKSYQLLCKRGDLQVHHSTLTIMVRVAVQERLFKQENIDTSRLSYSHRAELIKITDPAEKISLAQLCIDQQLSTRALKALLSKRSKKSEGIQELNSGELSKHYLDSIDHLFKVIKLPSQHMDFGVLKNLDTKIRHDMLDKTEQLIDVLTFVQDHLSNMKSMLLEADREYPVEYTEA
ncbi:MAG: hypothetical protein A2161_20250 [Candidatus Schekmanbacteria bacterium RBG_13_48_7]|uniref:Uncharacterized protein n=1 Tax=Candidatus Schekmanbacteria bacterium RBG_13_48_7 TaxID=1817878 RepID=A0A1F7RZV6_9BACT|nr:MAG: hypothetical protein A2161_20250 [Candidatus Schekmanbacteria bacterium RBG_13_48_7]